MWLSCASPKKTYLADTRFGMWTVSEPTPCCWLPLCQTRSNLYLEFCRFCATFCEPNICPSEPEGTKETQPKAVYHSPWNILFANSLLVSFYSEAMYHRRIMGSSFQQNFPYVRTNIWNKACLQPILGTPRCKSATTKTLTFRCNFSRLWLTLIAKIKYQ